MDDGVTVVAGIRIPLESPVFLAIVGVHVLIALACLVAGLVAMLSEKAPGRHPRSGTIYYWCLLAVFASSNSNHS